MKIKSTILICLSLMQMLLLTQQTEAYCILNNSNKLVFARQAKWGGTSWFNTQFSKDLKPRDPADMSGPEERKFCCPLKDSTCCYSGKTDEELRMNMRANNQYYGITFPAGGTIEIYNSDEIVRHGVAFHVRHADGTDFDYRSGVFIYD